MKLIKRIILAIILMTGICLTMTMSDFFPWPNFLGAGVLWFLACLIEYRPRFPDYHNLTRVDVKRLINNFDK